MTDQPKTVKVRIPVAVDSERVQSQWSHMANILDELTDMLTKEPTAENVSAVQDHAWGLFSNAGELRHHITTIQATVTKEPSE